MAYADQRQGEVHQRRPLRKRRKPCTKQWTHDPILLDWSGALIPMVMKNIIFIIGRKNIVKVKFILTFLHCHSEKTQRIYNFIEPTSSVQSLAGNETTCTGDASASSESSASMTFGLSLNRKMGEIPIYFCYK